MILSFWEIPYPLHQQILFALPSQCIQNSPHCCFPVPRQCYLSPALPQSFATSFSAALLPCHVVFSNCQQEGSFKMLLDHVSSLCKSSNAFSSHLISELQTNLSNDLPPVLLLPFLLLQLGLLLTPYHLTTPAPLLF